MQNRAANGPNLYQKDMFIQVRPKSLMNQIGASMMMDKSLNMPSGQGISDILESYRKPVKVYEEITYVPTNVFEIERVKDWNKRIEAYSEKTKNKYKLAFQKMEELKLALKDSSNWSTTVDSKKDKLLC